MCQTNKLVVNTPLGGISLCTLDELYSADRDIVAKLIGYLALSRAYNLVNDALEMIVTCSAGSKFRSRLSTPVMSGSMALALGRSLRNWFPSLMGRRFDGELW